MRLGKMQRLMAGKKGAAKGARGSAGTFTAEELAAMKEHVREVRRRSRPGKADGEADVLAKIAEMSPPDRAIAGRLHTLIKSCSPDLVPRTWYGMPAYAKDDEIVCFFQNSGKFKARYGTLGFSDEAKLDDGRMWPTSFALMDLTPAEEARIVALVKRAVG